MAPPFHPAGPASQSLPGPPLPDTLRSRSAPRGTAGAPLPGGFMKSTCGVGAAGAAGGAQRLISLAELRDHNKPGDAWIAIRSKVYDVSNFVSEHPGGPVILTHAGKDATDVFGAFHEAASWGRLPAMCIGEYVAPSSTSTLIQDFRDLKVEMLRRGMFNPSPLFYVYKFASTLGLLLAGLSITVCGRDSAASVALGALLVGVFWQQAAWLAHDFCHNQVFRARWVNHLIGGYFLGNLCQGLSVHWWKHKHNQHHAAPNECDDAFNPIDPDIDTLPLIAWSEGILGTVHSKALRRCLRWQAQMLFPVLPFARLGWCTESLVFSFSDVVPKKARLLERSLLLLHHAWVLSFAFGLLTAPLALMWLAIAELVSGFTLAFVFVQSHNGMEVYNDVKDFYTAQIVSTRNLKETAFNNWFSGGLNRQIEHHLFPTLPRHNFKEASTMVAALFRKHGLAYEDVGWTTGTSLVLRHLAKVAAAA